MSLGYRPAPWNGASDGGESYLAASVGTASPARLRLMLIERAVEIAEKLQRVWGEASQPSPEDPDGRQAFLKLLDLLNELLAGVSRGGDQALNGQVADLYVFLLQHLLAAEQTKDPFSIQEISTVLGIEAETWRLVCGRESTPDTNARPEVAKDAVSNGLNFQA